MGISGAAVQPVSEGNSESAVRFLIEWVSDGEAEARTYLTDQTLQISAFARGFASKTMTRSLRRPFHRPIVGARGDRPTVLAEQPADRLDPEGVPSARWWTSRAPQWPAGLGREKADAAFRISPPQLGDPTLQRLDLLVFLGGDPGRVPTSTSARRTHLRSVSADPMPSGAVAVLIAANSLS
jgi:hypothetical protein